MLGGLDIIIIGETLNSTYHNNLATNYRALIRELARLGHTVFFVEAQQEVYRVNRDLPSAPYCEYAKFRDLDMLSDQFVAAVRVADLVILGSGVPDCEAIAEWLLATAEGVLAYLDYQPFHLLAQLREASPGERTMPVLAGFDLFLGAAGIPVLREIQQTIPCKRVASFWGVVDQFLYYRTDGPKDYALGYLGNHHPDKMSALRELIFKPARTRPGRRYVIAGEDYPIAGTPDEPAALSIHHYVPTTQHVEFFNRLHYSLHIADPLARQVGYSPPPLLLEAAACGVPIITRHWVGMEEFLVPYEEIFVAENADEVSDILDGVSTKERLRRAERARRRVMVEHAPAVRAAQLIRHASEVDRANLAEL
jgi:spore maturation protein CgeB